ncbi:GNAT family N-acetyltransferase [Coprobacter sp.]
MVRFETDRLIIRNMVEDDLDVMLSIYSQEKNMRYISDGKYNWTIEELKNKYCCINRSYPEGYGIFIVEVKDLGIIIGEAGLFCFDRENEVFELGYILDSAYWSKGYGTEICRGLINYAFTSLKAECVLARMYASNKASVRLCEKCGMKKWNSGIAENGKKFYEYRCFVKL